MWKRLAMFCLVTTIVSPWAVSARVAYPYKKVSDFRTLEFFKSVQEFESSYGKYVQDCLDNTGGGTGGIPCFIGYDMWDGELNIYYNRLMATLGKKEKNLLKESQLAWIKEREKTIDFNSSLLDLKYAEEEGTMYALMRAGDADRAIRPIIRERALLLQNWLEFRQAGHVK